MFATLAALSLDGRHHAYSMKVRHVFAMVGQENYMTVLVSTMTTTFLGCFGSHDRIETGSRGIWRGRPLVSWRVAGAQLEDAVTLFSVERSRCHAN